jgi:hypothetical protein
MRRIILMVTVAVVMAAMMVFAGPASAAAGGPASCIGHEASNISPPGSSEEVPGGMPGLRTEIRNAFPGVPQGLVYSQIAKLHEGSHEDCDEALEG